MGVSEEDMEFFMSHYNYLGNCNCLNPHQTRKRKRQERNDIYGNWKYGAVSMKKEEKTNVMRVLDGKKIYYESHSYEPDATMSGEEIAGILGEDPEKVFKTLVTQGKSGAYYVFVVPVGTELDLKKAAKASGEKSVSMIKQKELLPLTGKVE